MDSHGLMAFQNIVWGSCSDSGFEEQPWALPLVLTPSSWICISNCIWPRRVYIPKSSLPTHVPIMNSNSYSLFCPSIRLTFWFLRSSSQFAVRRKTSLQWCFLHWLKRWLQQNVLQVLQAWELEEEIRSILFDQELVGIDRFGSCWLLPNSERLTKKRRRRLRWRWT